MKVITTWKERLGTKGKAWYEAGRKGLVRGWKARLGTRLEG